MNLFHRTIAAFALAATAIAPASPAAAAGTQYFVLVPGNQIPYAISSFSSDARADVASFSYGQQSGGHGAAHGKFSVASDGSPFDGTRSFPQLVVIARTPAKTITFTLTNVSIDDVSPGNAKFERVTFSSQDYDVKFSDQKATQ